MTDKGLDRLLYGIFGIGGMAILILVWIQPMTLSERILAIFIGSIGLLYALIRALLSRFSPVNR
jgi:hypothetical protein